MTVGKEIGKTLWHTRVLCHGKAAGVRMISGTAL